MASMPWDPVKEAKTCTWELPRVVADIPHDQRLEYLLASFTLTMSKDGVKAMPCKEYIERNCWGGVQLVRDILKALEHDHGIFKSDSREIRTSQTSISVMFKSSRLQRLQWNLVLWLCLTIRQPVKGKICLSIHKMDNRDATLQRLLPAVPNDTCCWFALFETGVIAVELGAEVIKKFILNASFHSLLKLAAVKYPVQVDGGLILMGYSTALVPMKVVNDSTVLWHLETANHDSQLKVADLSVTKGYWLKTLKLKSLKTEKALLGWSRECFTLLGTGQLGPVQWSDAKIKRSTWTWKGANLQFTASSGVGPLQVGGQAGLMFDRTINTLRYSASSNYLKCLASNAKEHIVIYDVGDSRAWLVPLISVYHEMLLAYWRSIPTQYRQSDIPLVRPVWDSGSGVSAVLRDRGGDVIEKSQKDSLTVRDMILGFSANMSRAILQRPGRTEIYGYEFMDIVMDSHKSELKRSRIKKEGLSWISVLDQVTCLFCFGMGGVIRGTKAKEPNAACNSLPKGSDWLATSICCIDELTSRRGGVNTLGARRLTSQNYWLIAGDPFQMCDHKEDSGDSCWDSSDPPLQEIQTGKFVIQPKSGERQCFEEGAIVFGRSRKGTIAGTIYGVPKVFQKVGLSVADDTRRNSAAFGQRSGIKRQHDAAFSSASSGGI
ncbi:hypothetical protein BDW74DRAFT_172632 [Aspergillus multicolor]|uniref:uncharacterized protein n=1 Tax=Aspergillus multicolor TaxID=41759 RepID=UPI003CCCD6A4